MSNQSRRARRRTSLPRLLPAALAFLFLVLSGFVRDYFPAPILSEDTTVHFIDVGQGDSTLFLSGGEAVLIDAGTVDMGEKIVNYLTGQGVTELRAVIATHPHADHIGGMRTVLSAFRVDAFFTTAATTTTWAYSNMLDMIESQNIPLHTPSPGDVLELKSGAVFRFLSPSPNEKFSSLNNASLVCIFEAGDARVLMMGDAEKEVEKNLLDRGADLRCDVIKLGHHGSNSSSTPAFLTASHARTAIISCASDNSYGHPHKETIKNLASAVIRDVRSTAKEGNIVITFPKNNTDKKEDAA